MSDEKQKDSRIAEINLLSNGYITVCDKDLNLIKDLSGAWSEEKEKHLRKIAPEGVGFQSWGILEYAKAQMDKYGKPE